MKGDSEHAATHAHGIQHRPEPPAPLTVEQRVSRLEARVEQLELTRSVPGPLMREEKSRFGRKSAEE